MNNLQQQLDEHLKSIGLSQAAAAKEMNISGAALNNWTSGKYKGNNERIAGLVQEYLDRSYRRSLEMNLIKDDFDFIETSIYKRILEGVEVADLRGEIRVVAGDSGVGKTSALKKIQSKRSGAIYLAAYAGIRKARFLSLLCEEADIENRGTCDDKFDALVKGLKDSNRLLLIDEAEHLSIEALDTLRSINDRTKCGLILAGLPIFYSRLRTRQSDYAYIYNRISLPVIVDHLKEGDVAQMVATILPEDCTVPTSVWFKACNGIGRDLRVIVQESLRVADVNRIPVSDTKRFAEVITTVKTALGRQITK